MLDDKPNEPTTEAGKRLVDRMTSATDDWNMYQSDAIAYVIAIEQEARADLLKERDELRAALRAAMVELSGTDPNVADAYLTLSLTLSKSEEQEGG